MVGCLPLYRIPEIWAQFQDGGRLKIGLFFCLGMTGIQPSYHLQIFVGWGLSRVLCWKWSTVQKRGNWRENLSAEVQWHRAASQDLTAVHVPENVFYINLFLAWVCPKIKGQCKCPFLRCSSLVCEVTYILGATTGMWDRILLAGSASQWAHAVREVTICFTLCTWRNFWVRKRPRTSRFWKCYSK